MSDNYEYNRGMVYVFEIDIYYPFMAFPWEHYNCS